MAICYLDSSIAVGALLGDHACAGAVRSIRPADRLFSSPLLEAEVLAALRRERVALSLARRLFAAVSFVTPTRSVRPEIEAVLSAGYVRGADAWHLATALYLAGNTRELRFITGDARQRTVAELLGFETS